MIHALRRTSPKGEQFVGTCVRCGRMGMYLHEVVDECPNTAGLSDEAAVMLALDLPRQREKSP